MHRGGVHDTCSYCPSPAHRTPPHGAVIARISIHAEIATTAYAIRTASRPSWIHQGCDDNSSLLNIREKNAVTTILEPSSHIGSGGYTMTCIANNVWQLRVAQHGEIMHSLLPRSRTPLFVTLSGADTRLPRFEPRPPRGNLRVLLNVLYQWQVQLQGNIMNMISNRPPAATVSSSCGMILLNTHRSCW